MNPYIYDAIIGKPIKRQRFYHNNELYSFNTDLRDGREWYSKRTPKQWVEVQPSIDLELSFETRKSRRLM